MNPSIILGWKSFVKRVIATRWTKIQVDHYRANPDNKENIHRLRGLVIQAMTNILKEIWGTRCGYITTEKILTEREMLRHRTLDLFNKNKERRDLLPLIDRHLFDKQDFYFYTSSRETLTLWESRVKDALRQIGTREPTQPTLSFVTPLPDETVQHRMEPSLSQRIQVMDEFLLRARRMR